MFKFVDRSPALSKLIEKLSTLLARQRGLPIVIGVVLVVVGFIIQLLEVYTASRFLELLGVIFHNLGVLIALIGFLLAEPLGK